jgi:hypothetical protein
VRSRDGELEAPAASQLERTDNQTLAHHRSAACIALRATECLPDENAAFDVLVNGDYAGHWAQTNSGATVTWIGDELIETEPCDGYEEVLAAIRRTIPASRLGIEEGSTPPKYDVVVVEAVILQAAAELHPEHLTTGGLLLKIVADPDDAQEIETGVQAIGGLQEVGLFTRRDDDVVEPTPAAVRAVKLLT